MELTCSVHGPESVTGVIHAACRNSCSGGCLGARWRLMPNANSRNRLSIRSSRYLYNFGRFVKCRGLRRKGDSFPFVCSAGSFWRILDSTLAGEALEGNPL